MTFIDSRSCSVTLDDTTEGRCFIHRLPVELFARILTDLFLSIRYGPGRNRDSYFRVLYQLLSTSKRWEEVIKGTPELWTMVESRCPPQVWKAALERSGSAPLDVECRLYGYGVDRSVDDSMFPTTARHVGRWRTAKLHLTTKQDLTVLESSTAPQLKGLDLSVHLRSTKTLDLFKGYAPKLSSLTLTRVAVKPWSSPILHNLVYLQISNCLSDDGPTLSQILDILSSSPELESLWLSSLRLTDDRYPIGRPTITLPRLAKFNLFDFNATVTGVVLSSLHIPHCTRFGFGWATVDAPYFKYITQAFESSLTPADVVVDINIGPESDNLIEMSAQRSSATNPSFGLSLSNCNYTDVLLRWVVPSIESHGTAVEINIDTLGDFSLHDVSAILRRLSGIRSIVLSWAPGDLAGILEMLMSAQREEDGSERWLCPNLRFVSIYRFRGDKGVLVSGVEARARASRKRAEHLQTIVRMEEFFVDGLDDKTRREILALPDFGQEPSSDGNSGEVQESRVMGGSNTS